MKELVIISGKGGSGKTSISASFAYLSKNLVVADCDVDTPNLHILLHPKEKDVHEFISGREAEIIQDSCTSCGLCYDSCRFNAINKFEDDESGKVKYVVDPIMCEGCGLCGWVCKSDAINFTEPKCGEWMVSDIPNGLMVHARLGIGAENSGKLVSMVKNKARVLAKENNSEMIIVDGPPGIGCPVIASISGASLVLIVTESTISGQHDMERVLKLAQSFKIPAAVCVNKWDINPEVTKKIEDVAKENNVSVVGRVRYDESVVKELTKGKVIVAKDVDVARDIIDVWNNVQKILDKKVEANKN